jgi:hypothetical protein
MPSTTAISSDKLVRRIGMPHCPALIDMLVADIGASLRPRGLCCSVWESFDDK